ncbi:MAG: hypothetical protein CMJ31_00585, partial [Phycisphaerae bacterium]|nr:hypothetical protein [Phycisphaerae bacterium]
MDEFSLDLTGGGGAAPSSWSASGPFERNLRALERRSPSAAAAIRAALPSVDLEFVETPEGEFGLRAIGASGRRTLASARAPLAEGRRLAETIDPLESGCVCVVGFGAGHHCRAMVERFGVESVVACFEPDVGLLRAVFERIDHSRWIESGLFILVTNADDGPALGRGLAGLEPLPMLGTRIVEHPASRERIGEASTAFGLTVMRVMKTTRAAVATALVHSRSTVRNLFMNIDRYATEPGVLDLAGIASGRPAIVVSAGPSLARSLPTLKRAEVRERFIVIGATTVLKTLLAEGIRPDFVCALDHHDLSRRFIEGLTAADVEGVTLVVEPKVNASVVDLYPGAIRMTQEDRLDDLLGGLKRPMGTIPAGATVAHLSYFLARWLGCDPVALVGQDLGFTDGQYYAGGAAIHEVWGGELNAFNTLEMMEWQRIVRQGGNLVRTVDHLGRPMFTDEQMAAYLQQFEAAFERDTAAGRRVIDATEGGAKKRFTEPMTLEGFVEAFGTAPKPELPAAIRLGDAGSRVGRLSAMLTGMSADAKTIAAQSRRSASMLGELAEALGDGPRFNRKVDELHVVRDEVEALEPAYGLVQHINQAGQLKRLKADRAIRLERESLDELGTRRRQIERDATNVSWLAEAADEVVTLIEQTRAAIEGRGPRLTRDHDVMISQALDVDGPQADPASVGEATSIREVVRAVVFAHDTVGGLGQARDLGAEVWNGRNALRLTVERLLFASELDGVTVVAGDVERARRLVGDAFDNDRVRVVGADAARLDRRTRRGGVGRLWAGASWRGGGG